jgi:hypothetical protein
LLAMVNQMHLLILLYNNLKISVEKLLQIIIL